MTSGSRAALLVGPLALAALSAGCGLALDLDPPDVPLDGGSFDASARDAGSRDAGPPDGEVLPCGGECPDDRVCVEGACRLRCDPTSDVCHDRDDVCEQCVDGACLPRGVCPSAGCFAGRCEPRLDRCFSDDTCAPLTCVGDECVEAPCTGDTDCLDLTDDCGDPYVCDAVAGRCKPRDRGECTVVGRECEAIDLCRCAPNGMPDETRCRDARPFCDAAGLFCRECRSPDDCPPTAPMCNERGRCVECVGNTECEERGIGVCEPVTGRCVECVTNAECADGLLCHPIEHRCVGCLADGDCLQGRCDLAALQCVECLASADCVDPNEPVCIAGRCQRCDDASCPPGTLCSADGSCQPVECRTATDCFAFACAGTARCDGGTCAYAEGRPGACDDGVACTEDRCDPAAAIDSTGCVHAPVDDRCEDGFACTVDFCDAIAGGCRHRPDDRVCASGPALPCALRVCVAHELDARIEDLSTGCGLAYAPERCRDGELCATGGSCVAAPECGLLRPCVDDGNPCNGREVCQLDLGPGMLARCDQVGSILTESCDGVADCARYCATTGCERRTALPPGPVCTSAVTAP